MIKLIVLLVLLPMMTLAADTKGGGGGIVVACYDKDGELATVELLDLYEAKAKGMKLSSFSGDFRKDVNTISLKMKHVVPWNFVNLIIATENSYTEIPKDAELELTNDAYPPFLPRGCKAKQVANYYNDGLIWIDSVLFEKMNYENQLALVLHETIYARERELGVSDSRYTRTIVAHAMSAENPFSGNSYGPGQFLCTSKEWGKVVFYAERIGEGENNQWRFDFTHLNGHKIYAQKTGVFGLPEYSVFGKYPSMNPNAEVPELIFLSSAVLDSKINGNESLTVGASSNKLFISWKGTDPGDSFRNVEVSCTDIHDGNVE